MFQTSRPELQITRIRHTLRFRLLQVLRVESITPWLRRVVLTGDALEGFTSTGFDDHFKLFFPPSAEDRPVLPEVGPNGPVFPEGQPRPVMRDYTPRHFDPARHELSIDFVLHDAGPASDWARQVQPGQWLGIGGPRGSFVIPDAFDWHLLIGDETALPAISRRLETLPAGKRALAVICVRHPDARLEFHTSADLQQAWCPATPKALIEALDELEFPHGEGYVWAAGESTDMRDVRQYLIDKRGIDKSRIKASGYWKRGNAAVYEFLDERAEAEPEHSSTFNTAWPQSEQSGT